MRVQTMMALLALAAGACGGGGAANDESERGGAGGEAAGGSHVEGGAQGDGGAQVGGESAPPDAALPDAQLPDAAPPEVPPPEVWGSTLLADENPEPGVFEATLVAGVHTVSVPGGPELEMWLYNGLFPGPRIDVRRGDRVVLHFRNELPEETTIHWHGLRIPDTMDGSPRIQAPVQPGETFDYDFVVPDAGTFWYHPHIKANEQIERGLYAPLVVRAPDEPVWDAERVFMVDDVLLNNRGDDFAPFMANHMEEMHGRFGNALVTNGSLEVTTDRIPTTRVERWHVINPANARTAYLRVTGLDWRVIATDGGALPEAYAPGVLAISPGQRFEVEVRALASGPARLESLIDSADADGNVVTEPFPLFEAQVEGEVAARDPDWRFVAPARPQARRANTQVVLELNGVNTRTGLEWQINGEAHAHHPVFTFKKGDVVEMTLENLAGPEHPFHLHGQFFEIYPDSEAWRAQPGLKDVVLLPGMGTVRLRAYMDNPGQWMMHCHILEHAELGMMATFVVEE